MTVSPRGGIVRPARRPAGWIAPGPPALTPPDRPELWPGEGEDLCYLSGDWRILQRTDGHRWSLDDLVTAWLAADQVASPPAKTLDLGCGLGTVLLLTAWRFPEARCLGVEAQDVSFGLAQRSLAWNGVEGRCEVRHGDFRDPALTPEGAQFDLVTGTPPYFPSGTGTESDHVQRAPCRFEHRGGIEDYCLAAARLLAPAAPFVACETANQRERVLAAADAAGLRVERWVDVIPRDGKPPLISVFALYRGAPSRAFTPDPPLVVRDAAGDRTPAFRTLRAQLGMP